MDHGHKAEDILTLVENGEMTLGYQSSSYLTDRVPELGFVDLPFLFANNAQARAAMDGALGQYPRAQDRGAHRLPHPRLVRERLSPHLQPAAPDPSAGRHEGHEDPRAAERDPPAHLRTARRGGDAHGPDRSHRHDQGRHLGRAGKSARQHRHLRRAQIPQIPHADLALLYFAPDLPASHRRSTPGRTICKRAMQRGGDRVGRVPAQARGRGARAVAQERSRTPAARSSN